jgi:hypothetical protein
VAGCAPGEIDCDGNCINPLTDNTYCGAGPDCSVNPGVTCGVGESCVGGGCVLDCNPGEINCGGDCVNPLTDNTYCGAGPDCSVNPGVTCGAGEICVGGGCVLDCNPGEIDCNGVCTDPLTDPTYCGAGPDCSVNPGVTCGGGEVCVGGSCQLDCPPGEIDCNSVCTDPLTDDTYCGAGPDCTTNPGTTCNANEICVGGQCELDCNPGEIDCNGVCTDPLTDNTYCGAGPDCTTNPGVTCQGGETCQGGVCQSTGVQELDIGPHGSDFQNATRTRGFYFTAPVAFTIVGVRVPTDVGTDVQNIQVVRFNSGPPPVWSADTTDFTTLAYQTNVPGTGWISVNIPVQSGDIIGILGARGTSTMHNPYGQTETYNTTILGQSVTLYRLLTQVNINTQQATALSTSTNEYSRVEVQYTP